MEALIILAVAIVIILQIFTYFGKQSNTKEDRIPKTPNEEEFKYPYEKKYLLTKTEYSFYKILKSKCDNANLLICPKVRLEDFINVTDNQQKSKYRGYIKSRHIDFMICDNNLNIKGAIELDDNTHNYQKAKKTDDFKNNLFKTIGIQLFRIKTSNSYENEIESIVYQLKN